MVDQPATTLTVDAAIDYVPSIGQPSTTLTVGATIDHEPVDPSSLILLATTSNLAFTISGEISVNVTPTPVPEGISVPQTTVIVSATELPFQLDPFGRPLP